MNEAMAFASAKLRCQFQKSHKMLCTAAVVGIKPDALRLALAPASLIWLQVLLV